MTKTHRNVRAAAKNFADACLAREATTDEQILNTLAELLDSPSVVFHLSEFPPGILGSSLKASSVVSVCLSPRCVTARHTLYHEIGHLILGHSYVDPHLLKDLITHDAPPGFECIYEHFLPPVGTVDLAAMECQAELFAVELTRLLAEPADRIAREWSYGLG